MQIEGGSNVILHSESAIMADDNPDLRRSMSLQSL